MRIIISQKLFILLVSLFWISACQSQTKDDAELGGPCEGCEAVFEYGDEKLNSVDTLPNYKNNEPKIVLKGKVLNKELEPIPNVILYVYHTDRKGLYAKNGNEEGWAKRHGYIRGWVKTDTSGNYTFHSFLPVAYPDSSEPQHIHITVKEPGKTPYFIDEFVFDSDPLLTSKERSKLLNRGGSGVIGFKKDNSILIGHRDIILGKNIPNYE